MRDVALSFSARADEKILDYVKPKTTAQEQALLHVAGALLVADRNGCWVSYSRSHDYYTSQKRYYGRHYGHRPILAAVNLLAEAGLIDNQIVPPGTHNFVRSRMRATPPLLELLAGTAIVPSRSREVLELRDNERNLIDYRETRQTRALRRQVEEINEFLSSIRLSHPAARRIDGHDILVFRDGRVLVSTPYLKRVFCRESFDQGGRFYGLHGSYQYLHSDERGQLLINGERVALIDFSAMHPTIVGNQVGIKFDSHPYDIPGLPREEVKQGLLIVLNAKTMSRARSALAWELAEQDGRDFLTESRQSSL